MKKLRILNKKAVSPVISTLLVIGIVVSSVGVIMVWGVPFIDEQKQEAQYANSKNDFLVLEESINQLIQTASGAKKLSYITNYGDRAQVNVKETSTKMVLWYSYYDELMDFTVSGLDDENNIFNITKLSGDVDAELNNVSVWWIDDTCFLAGTKVLMADGSEKNIEEIKPGDMVLSYDFNKKVNVFSEVSMHHIHKKEEMNDYYILLNDNLCVTPNHRFYTDHGWVEAGNLKINDKLFCSNLKDYSKVFSIKKIYQRQKTYDLTIKNTHNYYVLNNNNFVLVHNEYKIVPDDYVFSLDITKKTDFIYTGYPYKFEIAKPEGDSYYYRHNFPDKQPSGWKPDPVFYDIIYQASKNYEITIDISNEEDPAEDNYDTFKTEIIPATYFGENYILDLLEFQSTIVDEPVPHDISITGSGTSYTIESDRDFSGSLRIDLYSDKFHDVDYDTINGTLPFGKIWVFDFGTITHDMQNSDKYYKNTYENGAIFYDTDKLSKEILSDDPNIYINDDPESLGIRVVQIRTVDGYDLSRSGEGLVKLDIQTKSNYIRDMAPNSKIALENSWRTNLSNLYISFYGENRDYWFYLMDNFQEFDIYDSNTLKYSKEDFEFILSSIIVKVDLLL